MSSVKRNLSTECYPPEKRRPCSSTSRRNVQKYFALSVMSVGGGLEKVDKNGRKESSPGMVTLHHSLHPVFITRILF